MKTFKNKVAGLLTLFLCFPISAIAQTAANEPATNTYSIILIVVCLILIGVIFFGLEILNNPVNIVTETTAKTENVIAVNLNPVIGHVIDSKVDYILKIGFYCAIVLAILYLLTIILMIRII